MKKFAEMLVILIFCLGAFPARAEGPKAWIEADTSFWWTINEQVENGVIQSGSGDAAADTASGFNFKQGRLGFLIQSPDGKVEGLIRIRLEERTDIIDFWGAYHFAPWASVYVGQMKVPSTAEVLAPDHLTDFISRTTFGQNVGDYALSRTPYISSFMAVKSYNRDMGVALKGTLPDRNDPRFTYFLMVSNGIGSNNYIGGRESSEFLYTNEFGDYFYGVRLEGRPWSFLTVGAHYSTNSHDNVLIQDKKTVVDLRREVWSADTELRFPFGLRVAGFYGQGTMDDFFNSQSYRFDYGGWGAWAIQSLLDNRLELGLRYDSFTAEFQEDGNETAQNHWTYGVNWMPNPYLRLQLNYEWKDTVNEFTSDLDDDILYMNIQFLFDVALTP